MTPKLQYDDEQGLRRAGDGINPWAVHSRPRLAIPRVAIISRVNAAPVSWYKI